MKRSNEKIVEFRRFMHTYTKQWRKIFRISTLQPATLTAHQGSSWNKKPTNYSSPKFISQWWPNHCATTKTHQGRQPLKMEKFYEIKIYIYSKQILHQSTNNLSKRFTQTTNNTSIASQGKNVALRHLARPWSRAIFHFHREYANTEDKYPNNNFARNSEICARKWKHSRRNENRIYTRNLKPKTLKYSEYFQ